MRIEIKLLTQLKPYLPDSDLPGNTRTLELHADAKIKDVFAALGIPPDIPKVIMLNDRQGALEDRLRDGDQVTVFPPVGGG